MKDYLFKSGKFAGKSIAQVALTDYPSLRNLQSFLKGKNDFLYNSIIEFTEKLNNFYSTINCNHPPRCDNKADYLSIILSYGYIPRGDHEVYGPIGISVSPIYAYCKDHKEDSQAINKNSFPYKIKFDSLLLLPSWPKWVRKDAQKVLLQCAGFSGRKTEKNCLEFFNNLPQKGDTLESKLEKPKVIKHIQDELF